MSVAYLPIRNPLRDTRDDIFGVGRDDPSDLAVRLPVHLSRPVTLVPRMRLELGELANTVDRCEELCALRGADGRRVHRVVDGDGPLHRRMQAERDPNAGGGLVLAIS